MKIYFLNKTAWALYNMGDLVSKIMHKTNMWFLYSLYNKLMSASYSVQKVSKSINGPWKETLKDD